MIEGRKQERSSREFFLLLIGPGEIGEISRQTHIWINWPGAIALFFEHFSALARRSCLDRKQRNFSASVRTVSATMARAQHVLVSCIGLILLASIAHALTLPGTLKHCP